MKEMLVKPSAFEVVLALDEELSKRMGSDFSSREQQHRFVAVLLALKELGTVTCVYSDRETWFYLGDPKKDTAEDVLLIELNDSEMLRSAELSQRILSTLLQTKGEWFAE